jgi:peptidoglycan/LPS O-acetylase OafA/YrhL
MPEPKLIRSYMPELDTLRGIAILAVLLLHGFYWQYPEFHFSGLTKEFVVATKAGWLGVNLFFVLSGFLITGILLDSRDRPDYYRSFYFRRALRILPAYYLLLAFLLLLRQASPEYVGLSFIYLSNVTVLFGVANDYGPLWSLAVEEHYYILWPSLVKRLTPLKVAYCAFMICLAVPAIRAIGFKMGSDLGLATYTWFTVDGLAAGSLLGAILRTNISRARVKMLCATLFLFGCFTAAVGGRVGLLSRDNLMGAAFQYSVINILFAALLLMFLLLGTSPAHRYVTLAPLRFFGYISYGLYLIHIAVFRIYDHVIDAYWQGLRPSDGQFGLILLRFSCVVCVATGLAYLSRSFFEEWFLRLKNRKAADCWKTADISPSPQRT